MAYTTLAPNHDAAIVAIALLNGQRTCLPRVCRNRLIIVRIVPTGGSAFHFIIQKARKKCGDTRVVVVAYPILHFKAVFPERVPDLFRSTTICWFSCPSAARNCFCVVNQVEKMPVVSGRAVPNSCRHSLEFREARFGTGAAHLTVVACGCLSCIPYQLI